MSACRWCGSEGHQPDIDSFGQAHACAVNELLAWAVDAFERLGDSLDDCLMHERARIIGLDRIERPRRTTA